MVTLQLEDAQKSKERDAAARRAEMEAALDEEAVEPPTIPEDAPAGTQGRLFDDAPSCRRDHNRRSSRGRRTSLS